MERDTLSFSQLMALLFGALMGPAAELLPGAAAQAGMIGTLAVLGTGVAMAAAGFLLGDLAQCGGGLAQGLAEVFGRWGGRAVLLIYIVWCEVVLTLRLRLSAQRLLGSGERDGAVWFFLLVLGLMALWMGHGHLGALGRAAQLFFVALVLTGGTVLLLALFQVESGNLLSTWSWSVDGAVGILRPSVNALGYGLFAAFLFQPEREHKQRHRWISWVTGACLVLAVAQMIVVGRYGPRLTGQLHSPFFQLAKSVGVEGAFQRVESLVAAVWVFSDFLLLTGILWCMRRIGAVLCPKIPAPTLVTIAALPAMVAALALFGEKASPREMEGNFLPVGSLILALVVPALAILLKGRKRKK
ncbi:MAG: GerAB/ArcD/ProY family transporter [Oscillibacter sp.]|nr:GerAB/ArcD/ProY family transporter [Oscillibacter sp.]